MSGHSKWHNIQKKKGAVDAKKAGTFSRLVRAIVVAAKEGGSDIESNYKLRLAVDAARAQSMPKENIERALARASGADSEVQVEKVVYEAFGPAGVAILIECLTDNRNRTVADVKNILNKNGGTIANAGSVMWMFDLKGSVVLESSKITKPDDFELAVIDAGAENILTSDGLTIIHTAPADLQKMDALLRDMKMTPEAVGLEYVAKNSVKVEDAAATEEIAKLFGFLEEHDDVESVYTNEA